MNTEDPLQTSEELLRKSLNIKYEWSVLMEAQNVIDQLQIMQEIFTQQITLMTDFEKVLRGLSTGNPAFQVDGLPSTLERAGSVIADMKSNRDELADLEKRQAKTRTQIRELLDMKQQQSGIIEAKAGIRRADESVLQGRSIVVFTVVTIFFLPLSFFATLFGMNSKQLNEGSMQIGTQLVLMRESRSFSRCLIMTVLTKPKFCPHLPSRPYLLGLLSVLELGNSSSADGGRSWMGYRSQWHPTIRRRKRLPTYCGNL